MFYFKELYFRLIYILICLICSIITIYLLQDYLFDFFFVGTSDNNSLKFETSFVINSPLEFFEIQFYLCLLFSLIFCYPLCIVHTQTFLTSSLTLKEIKEFNRFFINHLYYYILLNILFLFIIIPNFWYCLEYTNILLFSFSNINVEYEPGLLRYINFVYYFVFIFNFVFIFFHLMLTIAGLFYKLTFYFQFLKLFDFFIICSFFIALFYSIIFLIIPILIIFLKSYVRHIILFNFTKHLLLKYEIKKSC